MQYTQRKFLSFPLEKQHKKCAEMLRALFETGREELFSHYNEIQAWMCSPTLSSAGRRAISDRYHEHLKAAGLSLREYRLLPRISTGDRERKIEENLPVTIYLDQIRSAHNVGSIIRTTEAFSLGTLAFSKDTPGPDHPQVEKTAMGSCAYVSCSPIASLEELPRPLIALETSPAAIPLQQFIFPETFTLVVGNEEYGCSAEILKEADYLIEIPLRGRKNSLNVANAFAIAAAEIIKQATLKRA